MRFKSDETAGYMIYAVTGTSTVSFAIDADEADTAGLLGFAVERYDPAEDQRYFLYGFKVFESIIPRPTPETVVTTFDHPVQSLVYDDFTAKPGRIYEYWFYPLKGRAKWLDRSAQPIHIAVRTEPQFDQSQEHDIVFNRGVASSQAYARQFGNKRPDDLPEEKRRAAEQWLSRDLDEAILRFIAGARKGDTLLCCFYEFRYRPVADALKAAINRGVSVRLIVDGKKNEHRDKKGVVHPSFPRIDNLAMLKAARIAKTHVVLREARTGAIQHNKFMVLLKGKTSKPREVWTGSTNISPGGIHGQTNVGHWIRNGAVAQAFAQYWSLLASDPGAAPGDDDATVRQKNKDLRAAVEALGPVPTTHQQIPSGTTPIFSPRVGNEVLAMYAEMVDKAASLSCITLAFGINNLFKELLEDNTVRSCLAFFLLEKEDKPNPRSKQPFITVNAKNNVYKAWGSFLDEPLHQWAKETTAGRLRLNKHVSFIHSKFLLMDPLGPDPIVVTGSANFSNASTTENDENMLVIRGNGRVADIYFTEFNRLFFHYYFRSVQQATSRPASGTGFSLFLREDDKWLKKYAQGQLRHKRVKAFARMEGFATP
jgi:phosphatidylserine/phosphatidylglycerophosphate/cardiolipin synthase-like enzyme